MTVSDFLKDRNRKILNRYNELKQQKIPSKKILQNLSREFNDLSVYTIEQIIYNKNYSNSPHKKK